MAENIGVLSLGIPVFASANWELDVIRHHGLDEERSYTLAVQSVDDYQAARSALDDDAVDAIVSDWLWVSRQRAEGRRLVFIPYSSAVGGLMVPSEKGIDSLTDLAGRTIGVAGDAANTDWHLIQSLAKQRHGMDLAKEAKVVFGIPPLLNEKIEAGELDAVLNDWQFSARLEALGYHRLLGIDDARTSLGMMEGLGAASAVPELGYVFREEFARDYPDLIDAFADSSRAAKALLQSDEEWMRIQDLAKASDEVTLDMLKRRFQDGVPLSWGEIERAEAAGLYRRLAEIGGYELVGPSPDLTPGTFWPHVDY